MHGWKEGNLLLWLKKEVEQALGSVFVASSSCARQEQKSKTWFVRVE